MRARSILFIISLMLLSVVMVFGQEEPTPISTETPTELPTETLTPSALPPPPTDTPIIVPTETPTETVTASPLPTDTSTMAPILTETPTETATETATPTATGTDGSMTPTVTETSTSTPTDGAEVTLTPTSTETPTPSNLVVGYEQHFEDDSDDMLLLATNATRIYHGTSYGMALPSDGAPFYLRTIGSTDAAVETRFLSSGTFTLHLFVTVQSQYTIHVNSMGQVLAFHDAELLASGQVSALPSPAWRMLYVTMSHATLSVFVDGEHALDVADAALPTTSLIAFSGAPDAVIDDVRLWATGDAELQSTMYSPPNGLEDNPALYAALFVQGDGLIYQPSTSMIYFTSGSTSGLAAQPDTSQIYLKSHVTARMAPSLSPNGSWLVSTCTVRAGLIDDICLVQVTGSATNGAIIRLTADTQADIGAVWSPDGTRIAFATSPSAGVTNIHIVQPDLVNFTVPTVESVIPNCTMPTWAGEYVFCQAVGTGVARGIRYYHVPTGESGDATTGFDGLPDAAPYGTGIRLAYTRYPVQNPQPWQVGTTEWGFFDPATRSFVREGGFPIPPENTANGTYLPVLSLDGTMVIIREAYDDYNYSAIPDVDFQEIYAYYLTSPIPTSVSAGGGLIDHISWQESGFPLNWLDLAPLFAPPTPTETPTLTPSPTLPFCPLEGQALMESAGAALLSPDCQEAPTPTPPIPMLTAVPLSDLQSGECLALVTGNNIRLNPAVTAGTVNVPTSPYGGYLVLNGVYDRADTIDPTYSPWYLVSEYYATSISPGTLGSFVTPQPNSAWLAAYVLGDWCNLATLGGHAQDSLPDVNALGTPAPSATPTPTITPTPTLDVTLTPSPTPTLYPTPTLGPTPTPPLFTMCSNRDQWIQDLCLQGWNYLSDQQRDDLTTTVSNGLVSTDFIALDEWWLRNIGRGIADVPPQVWQTDSLNQCAGNANCESIVHNVSYLFGNMSRIGVDLLSTSATGQTTNGVTFLPGLLPATPIAQGAIWGHEVDSLACRNGRFAGFNLYADVCWVCQDLSTELYRANGIDLEAEMRRALDYSGYQNPVSRLVPSVYNFIASQRMILRGDEGPYTIGEIAFLWRPEEGYFHSGIVMRGAVLGTPLEEMLDQVLIAQLSFSSQGYFTNNGEHADDTLFSEERYVGRFEIITLRTYLYKNLLGTNQVVPPPNAETLEQNASQYMAHGRPSELGY